MGERKGQSHYYPPDFNPAKHKNLNRYHGTHALRERAAKIGQGILIIRFEMPFNIWCLGCNQHVGMGVRYNAEKKKVGMYFTTPLYEFRMKCHLCENYYTIRTDPEHFDYVLVDGCKRQELRWDPSEGDNGGHQLHDRGIAAKMDSDAMYKLEHKKTDIDHTQSMAPRLEALERLERRKRDDFGVNQLMRGIFRKEKKEKSAQSDIDKALLTKSGLTDSPVVMVAENEDDKRLAKLIAGVRTVKNTEQMNAERRADLLTESIFSHQQPSTSYSSNTSSSTDSKQDKLLAAPIMSDLQRTIRLSTAPDIRKTNMKRPMARTRTLLSAATKTSIQKAIRPKRKSGVTVVEGEKERKGEQKEKEEQCPSPPPKMKSIVAYDKSSSSSDDE